MNFLPNHRRKYIECIRLPIEVTTVAAKKIDIAKVQTRRSAPRMSGYSINRPSYACEQHFLQIFQLLHTFFFESFQRQRVVLFNAIPKLFQDRFLSVQML